eukprot:Skav205641  [mRNA]  locus=scaffold458:52015:53958:+ [translate_table: standard]
MRTLKDLQQEQFSSGVGAAQDETFIVKELRPAVSGSDEAIGFRWHAEMFQWKQTRGENDKLTMDFDIGDCTSAATYDDENEPGLQEYVRTAPALSHPSSPDEISAEDLRC